MSGAITKFFLLIIFALTFSVTASAQNNYPTVSGTEYKSVFWGNDGKILEGDLFDDVLKHVKGTDIKNVAIYVDTKVPGSLVVEKTFSIPGKTISLVVSRNKLEGPYIVQKIYISQ